MRRGASLLLAALVAGGATAGCTRHEGLAPAKDALVPLDRPHEAYAEEQGVQIFVDGDAWRASPQDLENRMAPVLVTIRNHSRALVRVMYQDFKLESSGGIVGPLPTVAIGRDDGGEATRPTPSPAGFSPTSFYLFPRYRPFFPDAQFWAGSYPMNPDFYRRQMLRWKAPLPSPDMVRLGLPEGVLTPGGVARGFLYFPSPPVAHGARIVFWASLADGEAGTDFVNVRIPLQRR